MQSYRVAGKDRVRRFFTIEQYPYELSLSSLKDLGFQFCRVINILGLPYFCAVNTLSIHTYENELSLL